jgi:hypothetical protein
MQELSRRYWRWEALGVVFILAGVAISWWLFVELAHWRFSWGAGEAYWLSPNALVWGAPAFFVGILSATWPTDLLYRRLLGARYPEFRDYQTRKFGYDGRRWMLPFYFITGAMSATIVLLLLDCYVFFGPTEIHIDELWELDSYAFTYDQIMEIRASEWREGDDGQRVKHFTLSILFEDGTIWTSRRDAWYSGSEQLRDIAAHVAGRAGIPIVQLEVMNRIEL